MDWFLIYIGGVVGLALVFLGLAISELNPKRAKRHAIAAVMAPLWPLLVLACIILALVPRRIREKAEP